jgi:energy-converting hydrogenase A subunit M
VALSVTSAGRANTEESGMSEYEMELGEVVRKCHFCYQSFALQEDLVKHLKEAHGVEEEPA